MMHCQHCGGALAQAGFEDEDVRQGAYCAHCATHQAGIVEQSDGDDGGDDCGGDGGGGG